MKLRATDTTTVDLPEFSHLKSRGNSTCHLKKLIRNNVLIILLKFLWESLLGICRSVYPASWIFRIDQSKTYGYKLSISNIIYYLYIISIFFDLQMLLIERTDFKMCPKPFGCSISDMLNSITRSFPPFIYTYISHYCFTPLGVFLWRDKIYQPSLQFSILY